MSVVRPLRLGLILSAAKRSRRTHGFASVFAALLCAAGASAQTTSMTTVRMGVVGRPDQAPFELAYRRGYFEKRGIKIEEVPGSSGQEFASALATEQMQVATGVPNAALFNAMNRGINIRIVADFAHLGDAKDRTVSIMVRSALMDSGQVKGPADLKGRIIAAGPYPGQYPDLLWSKVLALGHLGIGDVHVVHMGFADALAAMGSNTVDAAFMIEPLVTEADVKNIARILLPAGAVDQGAELSVVLYSPDFSENLDLGTRFLAAFLEGARDYDDAFFHGKGKDAAIALLAKYLPVKDPKIWETSRQFTDLDGRVNIADLKRQAAFLKQQGTVSGPIPDIDAHVDERFAKGAVALIGAR
ncbi:MAG TPA: ABC transporter substrate-binding protein [Stellaceae bacterium]|nr:ABC transporter substrate-binding protein [Stellaceae bacterium]